MPKDFYAFIGLLAAMLLVRLLPLPRGLHLFLFSLIVVGQVALLTYGLIQARKAPGRRRPD